MDSVMADSQNSKGKLPPPRLSHIPALDGVRGLAIAMVLATHSVSVFGDPYGAGAIGRAFYLAHTGVDLFFVLSGFLITCVLLDTREFRGYFVSFFCRRGLRIWPLYFCVVGLILLVLAPVIRSQVRDFGAWRSGWPWNLGLATNLYLARHGNWTCAITDVTWSVSIEEQFYIVWPFVVVLLGRRYLSGLATAMIVLAMCSRAWIATHNADPWFVSYLLPWTRMDSLAVGALLASAIGPPSEAQQSVSRTGRMTVGIVLSVLLIVGASLLQANWYVIFGFLGFSLGYGVLLATALYTGPGPVRVFVNWRSLRFLGRVSYCIYLVHLIVGYGLKFVLEPWISNQWAFYLIGSAGMVGGSIGLGVLSWYLFESRLLRLTRYVPRPGSS
jgi:peptidoglycan/LPS O-acetylase OafA/YrhL